MAKLPNQETNFADWYQEVIYQSELIDLAPVRGCFVIRPYGYAIWERLQAELDHCIKITGHENVAFPLLIPESFLKKEADHVEGFAPELAVVTQAGGKELEEPLVIRPTSETMAHYMFARWIKSWRDLPIKINQWANVIRWEMRPRAFLRTTEFFWQEGHTAHETLQEAQEEALLMLEQYRQVATNILAIPVVAGQKSEGEKFPGATRTYTIESLMPDGKAVQSATSHIISRDFARAFNMTFQNRDGKVEHPYLTSWGATTRLIGTLIMIHGDDRGLVLPPRIAPIQVVIVPILKDGADNEAIITMARDLENELSEVGVRVLLDENVQKTPGAKFYHWELKGVPLRVEIGPRDVLQGQVTVVDRMTSSKTPVLLENLITQIPVILKEFQDNLLSRARKRMSSMWYKEEKIDNIIRQLEDRPGFYQTGWCGNSECEKKLKEHKTTIRVLLEEKTFDTCFNCLQASKTDILVAKSY